MGTITSTFILTIWRQDKLQ